MEHSKEIVKELAKTWRMCKKQENLFKSWMSVDYSDALRKTCGHGNMIFLIFRKEIGRIYDDLKCNLQDADLNNVNISFDSGFNLQSKDMQAKLILLHLNNIKDQCLYLIKNFELYKEYEYIFKDYTNQITEVSKSIESELITILQPELSTVFKPNSKSFIKIA